MIKKTLFIGLCISSMAGLSIAQNASNVRSAHPAFNKATDVLIAQFDNKPDADDIHSQAALGCILKHPDANTVNVYAVQGAYGKQWGTFIDSTALFNLIYGTEGANTWTNAHPKTGPNWTTSVTRIFNKVKPILLAGGRVWVQEAGQSDITADWIAALIADGMPESTIKSKVIVVQHSGWNESETTAVDLTYVKSKTTYVKIDDGNNHGNATPDYNRADTIFMNEVKNGSANASAESYWLLADQIIVASGFNASYSVIHLGGVDYSDCCENWWILDLAPVLPLTVADNYGDVRKFWDRYVIANAPPTVTVSATDASAGEPADNGTFTFTRSGETSGALTVNFTVSGTASSGLDYTSIGTSVTIPAGQASTTKTVAVSDDTIIESSETVIVTLSSGSYVIGSPSGTVTIADNDSTDIIITNIAAQDAYIQNSGGMITVVDTAPLRIENYTPTRTRDSYLRFDLAGIPEGATIKSVTLRLNNQRPTAADGTYVVYAGSTGLWVDASPGPNTLANGLITAGGQIGQFVNPAPNSILNVPLSTGFITTNGSYNLVLKKTTVSAQDVEISASENATEGLRPALIINIETTQLPSVTVSAADASAGEPADNGTFTFTRSGSTAADLTVYFVLSGTATSGSDYQSLGTSVTIPAGQASATRTLTIIDDAIVESSETAIVTLASGTGYTIGTPNSGTVNIVDNDDGSIILDRTGWVATASSANGVPANALDGNIGTRWSTGINQTPGQWFQMDLASTQTFNKIVLDAGSSTGDYPRGYEVRVSIDGLSWGSPVATGVGSSVTTITFATQTARYIRVTQTGSVSGLWWSIHEFNVYAPAGGLPSPWQTADIGAVATTGSATYSSPTWTMIGSGSDIWNAADEFRYVYQSSSGDCSVVARVASLTNTDPWAKSGAMIRESTNSNAINAMVCVTPGNGVSFQWRGATGAASGYANVTGLTTPKWLKIERTVNSFAASYSDNGTTWTPVGTAQTIAMATNATIGMAVTSHNNGVLCTSTVDSVTATP